MSAFTPRDPDYAEKIKRVVAAQAFMEHIGSELLHVAPGEVDIGIRPGPHVTQFTGALHGGVVSALADHAAGGAATSLYEAGQIAVTVELKVNFLEPATGDLVVARARVERPGRSISVVTSRVYAQTGETERLCALATVTLTAINATV